MLVFIILAKLQYFTYLNCWAIKANDFPNPKHHLWVSVVGWGRYDLPRGDKPLVIRIVTWWWRHGYVAKKPWKSNPKWQMANGGISLLGKTNWLIVSMSIGSYNYENTLERFDHNYYPQDCPSDRKMQLIGGQSGCCGDRFGMSNSAFWAYDDDLLVLFGI